MSSFSGAGVSITSKTQADIALGDEIIFSDTDDNNIQKKDTVQGVVNVVDDKALGTAKAWVNFNGTGSVSIRESHNVSSITDNGEGDYTINLSITMANANYAALTASSSGATLHSANDDLSYPVTITTSSVRVLNCRNSNTNSSRDPVIFMATIYGEKA